VDTGLAATYAIDPSSGRILAQVPTQEELSDRIEIITGWQQLLAAGD